METNNSSAPIQINLSQVIKSRLGAKSRFIPRFVVRWLERLICQDRMNEMLRVNAGRRDADFARGVVDHLGITFDVKGERPDPANRRVIVVSNHPLGGLDGMILIDLFTRIYGGQIHFVVNDLLMAVEPLRGVFLPINKHGRQSRSASMDIDQALAGNDPVIIFPAGLCSRKQKGGVVADLRWNKMFVTKAIKYHRNIVPVFFSGQNSKFFYNFAKLRERIGLKFNIEMIRLPREIFLAEGSHFDISIGSEIDWQSLKGGADSVAQAEEIKRKVYSLDHHD